MSQRKLEKLAELPTGAVSRLERGQRLDGVSADALVRLAHALGVTVAEVLGESTRAPEGKITVDQTLFSRLVSAALTTGELKGQNFGTADIPLIVEGADDGGELEAARLLEQGRRAGKRRKATNQSARAGRRTAK